jgi:transcriptional antiterminator RfaH
MAVEQDKANNKMIQDEKHWYAAYTKPRFEKKAKHFLDLQGIENWLPMHRVKKQWTDRVKWVEEAVFKSYIFVYIGEKDYFNTLNSYGIVRFVSFERKAVPIPEDQMDFLRRLFDTGYELESADLDLKPGDRVEIRTGPLAGRQGTLVSRAGDKKVRVDLEVLQQSIFITVPIENLLTVQ